MKDTETINWVELNRIACDEASLTDMCSWAEAN